MKRIVVHIGAHKTGTTLIQHTLVPNRELLKQFGVNLVQLPVEASQLIAQLMKGKITVNNDVRKAFVKQFRAGLEVDGDALISYEGFSGMPFLGRVFYSNAATFADLLDELVESYAYMPAFIVYLRRQDTFIESWYNQSVKMGETRDFPQFFASIDLQSFRWQSILEPYVRKFGASSVHVRFYEDFKKDPSENTRNFIREFWDIQLTLSANSANESLTRIGLELMLAGNRLGLSSKDRLAFRRFLEGKYVAGGPPKLLSDDMRGQIAHACKSPNADILQAIDTTEDIRRIYAWA